MRLRVLPRRQRVAAPGGVALANHGPRRVRHPPARNVPCRRAPAAHRRRNQHDDRDGRRRGRERPIFRPGSEKPESARDRFDHRRAGDHRPVMGRRGHHRHEPPVVRLGLRDNGPYGWGRPARRADEPPVNADRGRNNPFGDNRTGKDWISGFRSATAADATSFLRRRSALSARRCRRTCSALFQRLPGAKSYRTTFSAGVVVLRRDRGRMSATRALAERDCPTLPTYSPGGTPWRTGENWRRR